MELRRVVISNARVDMNTVLREGFAAVFEELAS